MAPITNLDLGNDSKVVKQLQKRPRNLVNNHRRLRQRPYAYLQVVHTTTILVCRYRSLTREALLALGPLIRPLLHPHALVGVWVSSQFEYNYFAEMCSGSEAGSYLRLIDLFITQL